MIKQSIALFVLLLSLGTASATVGNSAPLAPAPEHGVSAVLTTKFIEQYHYKKTPLNDEQSADILNHYIDALDPNRNIFTQADIDAFQRYKTLLDDSLHSGKLQPAFEIFKVFNQRRIERADYALERLTQPFDFTRDESYRFDRSEAAWPKDRAELDEIWRKRVKNDVLILSLAHKSDEELKKTLRKRYERLKSRSEQFKAEDVYALFINAYLQTVEPHTSYFSPRASENFKINMSLSLEGIGAVLRTEDDYTVVQSVVKGGPADLGGQLHADDRITGVAQGEDGKIEDVVGWRLDDVVDLIRGPKDSVVRLQILPHETGLDGPAKEITIVRNKIKLEEQQAKKSIIEVPPHGEGDSVSRIGVITIPTFYMDFDAYARGEEDYRSTTRDTHVLIDELMAEKVDGIIIDLRGNGGGSLAEAVSLTGLFIKSGPVVQIRDSEGKVKTNDDDDKSITYTGPLAVLVDRYSASASEIFAGAIQDYGRGTIIGEPTFGKGTVQSIIDLNRFVREPHPTLGQLKLTIAQFFRVNGDSTQHRGVIPDIIFPTAEQSEDQGERSLENALPWANIKAANFAHFDAKKPDLVMVEARHEQRLASDEGFEFLLTQAQERHNIMNKTTVSLLKEQRKKEREQQEEEHRQRLNKFRVSVGLEPQEKKEEDDSGDDDVASEDNDNIKDEILKIQLKEAAAILVDMIHLPNKNMLTDQTARQSSNRL